MKRSPLKRTSKKKTQELKQERIVKQQLLVRSGGKCEDCGGLPDFRGLVKHEIIHRSQGGSPVDIGNCKFLCGKCHSKVHKINEV